MMGVSCNWMDKRIIRVWLNNHRKGRENLAVEPQNSCSWTPKQWQSSIENPFKSGHLFYSIF